MTKGSDTKASILRQALNLSSEVGLESLSLGGLAKRVGMSKSGLYAHFKSKEELQSLVLDSAADLFVDRVVARAIKEPRGLPRLHALFDLWLEWASHELTGGCLFIAASTELDDRSGPVRESLVKHMTDLTTTINRAAQIAVEEKHFRSDLEPEQLAFEIWGLILSFHQVSRLMRKESAENMARNAFHRLLKDAQASN